MSTEAAEAAEAEAEADADPATASSKAQARGLLGKTWDKRWKTWGKHVILDDFFWCLMIFFEETWSNKCDFMVIEPTNRGDVSHKNSDFSKKHADEGDINCKHVRMIENLCNKDQRHSETLGWVNTSLGMKTILSAHISFFLVNTRVPRFWNSSGETSPKGFD